MTLPGETIATGAPHVCTGCHQPVNGPLVLSSAAGYFIGYGGCNCGPVYSRESLYFTTRALAETAFRDGWEAR